MTTTLRRDIVATVLTVAIALIVRIALDHHILPIIHPRITHPRAPRDLPARRVRHDHLHRRRQLGLLDQPHPTNRPLPLQIWGSCLSQPMMFSAHELLRKGFLETTSELPLDTW